MDVFKYSFETMLRRSKRYIETEGHILANSGSEHLNWKCTWHWWKHKCITSDELKCIWHVSEPWYMICDWLSGCPATSFFPFFSSFSPYILFFFLFFSSNLLSTPFFWGMKKNAYSSPLRYWVMDFTCTSVHSYFPTCDYLWIGNIHIFTFTVGFNKTGGPSII